MCTLHDTLRNDADDGDECVECGATFPDARRPATHTVRLATTPPGDVRPRASSPTSSDTRPWMRPGWFHNVQLGGHTPLDKPRARR